VGSRKLWPKSESPIGKSGSDPLKRSAITTTSLAPNDDMPRPGAQGEIRTWGLYLADARNQSKT
jgi:hypothetical protein